MIKKINDDIDHLPLIVKIIACIIMTIFITLMSFLFVGVSKVNALTTDVMDNFIIYKEGGTLQQGNDGASVTTTGSVEAINFNFGNLEGNVSGQVQITFKYLTNRVGGMYLFVYTGGNLDTNASTSKSCQFTTNGNYYTAKCQFNFNTINETSKYTLLQVQFNPTNNILANIYTASGTAQITPTDLATSNDIQQQTISIIQNAISNTMSISEQIIESNANLESAIANIMTNTTNSIQESIINSYKHCETINNSDIEIEQKYLRTNGVVVDGNTAWGITKYYDLDKGTMTVKTAYDNDFVAACYYTEDKTLISCFGLNTLVENTTLTPPSNAKWFRSTILITQNKPQYKYCQSNTDAIIENQNQNTDRFINYMVGAREAEEEEWEEEKGLLQSILSAIGGIFSSSIDDPSNTLNSFNNSIANNNTVSSLLLLPVRLYQNVLNNINGSCNSFTLGSLYNHNLTMTCIQPQGFLGSALYGVIDVIISGFFILHIRKKFVDIFNHLTSLRTGGNELE